MKFIPKNSKQGRMIQRELILQAGGMVPYLESLSEDEQDMFIDEFESMSPTEQAFMMQAGGVIPTFEDSEMGNVEVEDGESVKTPDGNLYKFEGAKHSQGGIDVNLPGGSKVYSEYLKAPKYITDALLNRSTKKKYSYADLSKMFPTEKFEKVLNNPSSDSFQKRGAALQLDRNKATLETIFEAQELDKADKGKQNDSQYAQEGVYVYKDPYANQFPEILTEPSSTFTTGVVQNINSFRIPATDNSQYADNYELVVTETNPSTLGSNPTRRTEYVPDSGNPKIIGEYEPYDRDGTPYRPVGKLPQKKAKTKTPAIPAPPVNNGSQSNDYVTQPLPQSNPFVQRDFSKEVDPQEIPQSVKAAAAAKKKRKFGIDPKLAGTALDIMMAMSDNLDVDYPWYRDLRKYPIMRRFTDFEDQAVSKQYSQAVSQIQNSNMPEQVKQSRIADLNSKLQDYQGQIDLTNQGRYDQWLETNLNKVQVYQDANVNQQAQDLDRYQQQKARVEYLKDQFQAQRKSRIFNAARSYMDYLDDVRYQNQLVAKNYRYNPFSGNINYTQSTKDPIKEQEAQLAEYSQRSKSVNIGNLTYYPELGIVVNPQGQITKLEK